MSKLTVWTDSVSYCVAESGGEALRIYAEHIGEDPEAYDEAAWGPLPEDFGLVGNEHDDTRSAEVKTPAEWAKGGKRYLFSTEHLR